MGSKYPLISKKTMATWNDSDYIRPIIRRSLMWGGLPAEIKSGRGRRSKQLMSWSTGRRGLASEHDLAEIKFLAPSGAFALRLGGVKDVLLPSTTGGQCASCKGFHHSGTGATPISRDCCHRVGPDALLWPALSYTAPTLSFTVISFSSHVVLRPQLNKHLKSISHVFRGELWFRSKIMKARKIHILDFYWWIVADVSLPPSRPASMYLQLLTILLFISECKQLYCHFSQKNHLHMHLLSQFSSPS